MSRKSVTVRGYIDTGSDGTIVTEDINKKLELHHYPVATAEIKSIGGKQEERVLYAAIFIVGGLEIVTAVDIRNDVEEILLGRNVLQHLNIDIDWKKGNVSLRDP
ncbi:MAG: retroviral-like aspartic protease family protein [Candidatus Freyarchaeota archaeon]|nr:retroviral-like aspartic protease family protein [Candidatus Jordarchaeia archaeon]MBS7268803.1 retroviral-like aspartic protease family protein [Candidatus Jordarchaeia archaeon]MBS7279160.1 retroviral-like aspartic protease family protein [Candidatus Jordarchaeia archaeon]